MLSQTEARGVSSSPRGSWAEAGSKEITSIAKKCDPEPMWGQEKSRLEDREATYWGKVQVTKTSKERNLPICIALQSLPNVFAHGIL